MRRKIHDIFLSEIFSSKGGEYFYEINGTDVRYCFLLMDLYYFSNYIREELIFRGSSINFFTDGMKGKNVANIIIKEKEIDVTLFPNAMIKYNSLIEGDRIDLLIYVIEHLLVKLILYFSGESQTKFSGFLKKYFDYPEIFSIGFEEEGRRYSKNKPETKMINIINNIGLMINFSNSCYLDSLLMSFFLMSCNLPRSAILDCEIGKVDYKSWSADDLEKDLSKRRRKIFREICGTSEMESEMKVKDNISFLQRLLKEDFFKIIKKKDNFRCNNTRRFMERIIPQMRGGDIQSVSEIYSFISDFFPKLKVKNIPTKIKKGGERDGIIEERKSFLFWDFIGSEGGEGSYPKWDEIHNIAEFLTFQNGLIPEISDYGKVGREGNLKKDRCFSEWILEGKFRLCSVIINRGRSPRIGREEVGGGHYTAYIRPFFDPKEWYHYDDLQPSFEKVKGLPGDLFTNGIYTRPELLFYERVI